MPSPLTTSEVSDCQPLPVTAREGRQVHGRTGGNRRPPLAVCGDHGRMIMGGWLCPLLAIPLPPCLSVTTSENCRQLSTAGGEFSFILLTCFVRLGCIGILIRLLLAWLSVRLLQDGSHTCLVFGRPNIGLLAYFDFRCVRVSTMLTNGPIFRVWRTILGAWISQQSLPVSRPITPLICATPRAVWKGWPATPLSNNPMTWVLG